MEKITCKYCGESKSADKFEVANIINGKKYRRRKCNSCYVTRKSERRREITDKIRQYKQNLKCKQCDNNDFRVLDFHHNGDEKDFNVGDACRSGYSFLRIKTEMDKCEVLCANCHRILHYERKNGK
jgi:hypothetical protein